MSKQFEIEVKDTQRYILYDKEEFYEARERALRTIDDLIAYLNDAKQKVSEFEPNDVCRPSKELGKYSNGFERNNVLDKIRDDLYDEEEICDGYTESIGYCANVLKELGRMSRIGWNLYNQEKFAGRIEEYWIHFR
jgi:hypothetical protein